MQTMMVDIKKKKKEKAKMQEAPELSKYMQKSLTLFFEFEPLNLLIHFDSVVLLIFVYFLAIKLLEILTFQ